MNCPRCTSKTIVFNTRQNGATKRWRRHKCQKCSFVFTTVEKLDTEKILFVENDKGVIPFDDKRLYHNVAKYIQHLPNYHGVCSNLVDQIQTEILSLKKDTVESSLIEKNVMKYLKDFDLTGYTLYCARKN